MQRAIQTHLSITTISVSLALSLALGLILRGDFRGDIRSLVDGVMMVSTKVDRHHDTSLLGTEPAGLRRLISAKLGFDQKTTVLLCGFGPKDSLHDGEMVQCRRGCCGHPLMGQ